jgi:hypothetical protein
MAGSYKHLKAEDGTFCFDLIENMGDAHEACEDCFKRIATLERENAAILTLIDDVRDGLREIIEWTDSGRSDKSVGGRARALLEKLDGKALEKGRG